jgi:hypothetical protein
MQGGRTVESGLRHQQSPVPLGHLGEQDVDRWATHDFDFQVMGEDLDPFQEVLHKDAPLAFVGPSPDWVHVEIREDARH